MKTYMKYISLFALSFSSMAVSCPDNYSDKEIAKRMIEVEFSGVRVTDMEESYCLNQSTHPYILVSHDAPVEVENNPSYYVKSDVEIKILDLKKIDKDTDVYEVKYQFKAKDLKGKEAVVSTSLKYMKNVSAVVQKKYGCAGIIEGPEQTAIYKRCKR